MKKEELKKILKKCFGKEKDDKYHAIAMLCLYGLFMILLVAMIRIGGSSNTNRLTPTPTPSPTSNTNINNSNNNNNIIDEKDNSIEKDNINYSYSYTITSNGNSEVFLGKKVNSKEKITYIKDGITEEYAVLNDNYLILENNSYHITNSPSNFFKYCDINKILAVVDREIPTENNGIIKYQVSNKNLALEYSDKLEIDNEQNNSIILTIVNDNLKSADLVLDNYISSVMGETNTLSIHMEFVDIGTTQDFTINIS